jgi:hypothetical protein
MFLKVYREMLELYEVTQVFILRIIVITWWVIVSGDICQTVRHLVIIK